MKRIGLMMAVAAIFGAPQPVAAQEIGERVIRDTRIPERKIPPKFVIQPPLPVLPGQEKDEKGPIASAVEGKMAKDAGAEVKSGEIPVEGEAGDDSAEVSESDEGGTYSHDHGDGNVHSHDADEDHD